MHPEILRFFEDLKFVDDDSKAPLVASDLIKRLMRRYESTPLIKIREIGQKKNFYQGKFKSKLDELIKQRGKNAAVGNLPEILFKNKEFDALEGIAHGCWVALKEEMDNKINFSSYLVKQAVKNGTPGAAEADLQWSMTKNGEPVCSVIMPLQSGTKHPLH